MRTILPGMNTAQYLISRSASGAVRIPCTVSILIMLFMCCVHIGCATTAVKVDEKQEAAVDDDIPVTVVSYPDYNDPLIHINRAVFMFNHAANVVLLVPLSKAYLKVVPLPVHEAISRFFDNIKTPVYFFNHLFQLKLRSMGVDLARFGINSTIGVLGLFDPAESEFKIQKDETSFEDTLAHYGTGYGLYIVLPVLGPSDLRDSVSLVADHYLNPITYLNAEWGPAYIQVYDRFNHNAPAAEDYEELYKKTEEPYLFFRNLYLQGIQRNADY